MTDSLEAPKNTPIAISKPLHRTSPFLTSTSSTTASSLAVLHLRRDHSIPTILASHDSANEGYEEGKVTNTRFGSFPHSTLIGLPWGSQVRASAVNTGSRGRRAKEVAGQKRKRDGDGESGTSTPGIAAEDVEGPKGDVSENATESPAKAAKVAESGFLHILPPTPEIWTVSLPHRTQVVYTPDYSFVLQRLRALPGTQLIEAGAGSGSFSHAAARRVFSGYPHGSVSSKRKGKVWSFEFHEQRCLALQQEIRDHGLEGVVEVNHRDVYEDGFTVDSSSDNGEQMVQATAVFLDLPDPSLALRHLKRRLPASKSAQSAPSNETSSESNGTISATRQGPLSAHLPVHVCCFLPCIEQVQQAVTTLKTLGWQEVSVVEVAARRIDIRRERTGINEEGLRGVNPSPASVDEALFKLREAEQRTRAFHASSAAAQKRRKEGKGGKKGIEEGEDAGKGDEPVVEADVGTDAAAEEDKVEKKAGKEANGSISVNGAAAKTKPKSKQERLQEIKQASESRKLYKEGKLLHRAEPEIRTHTSYLVFAILPREWSEEDETRAREKWGSG